MIPNETITPQYGFGLPKDLHLAKRYYDMSLRYDPDAALAVFLSLGYLGVEFAKDYFQKYGLTLGPFMKLMFPSQASTTTPTNNNSGRVDSLDFDTILLIIFTIVLIFLLYLKQRNQ